MTDDEQAERIAQLSRGHCRRCGDRYMHCFHFGTFDADISVVHAARIAARYAIGRQFDPAGHDTNDYFTDPPELEGACAPAGEKI